MNKDEANQLLSKSFELLASDAFALYSFWTASCEDEYPERIEKLRNEVKSHTRTLRLSLDFGADGVPVATMYSRSLSGEETQLFYLSSRDKIQ